MLQDLVLTPPIAFIIVFVVVLGGASLFSFFAYNKHRNLIDAQKAYACGEEFTDHLIQPDYSQFFPFAFFFTILHIVALVIATVPTETVETFAMAITYIVGAVIGLLILLRK
jgi:hypothetical protein